VTGVQGAAGPLAGAAGVSPALNPFSRVLGASNDGIGTKSYLLVGVQGVAGPLAGAAGVSPALYFFRPVPAASNKNIGR